jgi:deazaflavin-dependent oxidoreductase (nitroreductase family)
VVSGFGEKSNWYQNIMQEPEVVIQVGTRVMAAQANQLDPDSAERVFLLYVKNNPNIIKFLSKMLGYQLDHTPKSLKEFSRQIPIIQFTAEKLLQ